MPPWCILCSLFDPVDDQPYLKYGEEKIATPAARADNALAARQGLVLLQGGPLPFPRGTPGAVTAVIGFCGNSTDALVSNYVNQFCVNGRECFPTLLQSIGGLGEATAFAQGCSSPTACPPPLVSAAVALAGAATTSRVVLCLGIGQGQEAEQLDRVNTTLPGAQQLLFAGVAAAAAGASKPLAVVLVHGGALSVGEVKGAQPLVGIIDAFYPGPEGGGAIADALFGEYNPGGKLPYTVYGEGYAGALDMADMRVAEVGRTYRYYGLGGQMPGGGLLWPFGFGLSYTTFSLDYTGPPALLLTPSSPMVQLPVRVSNTGGREGDEVLQVYIAALAGSLSAPVPPYVPVRSLVFFERLRVGAGQGSGVSVTLTAWLCNLTLSDGTQKPVDGNYTVILSRGQGVGPEIPVPLSLSGW